jgi:hypothetical protein
MVVYIVSVNGTYQSRLLDMPYLLNTSYVQAALGEDGVVNTMFLTFLFSDTSWAYSSRRTWGSA